MIAVIPAFCGVSPDSNLGSTRIISDGSKKTLLIATAFVPSVQTEHLVSALSVYAAGRKSFDAIVRCNIEAHTALALIFSRLPLEEHGWEYEQTTIKLMGNSKNGWPVWRISRS